MPDGRYRLRVTLGGDDRTITIPTRSWSTPIRPPMEISRVTRSATAVVIHFLAGRVRAVRWRCSRSQVGSSKTVIARPRRTSILARLRAGQLRLSTMAVDRPPPATRTPDPPPVRREGAVTGAELGSVLAAAGLVPLLATADLRLRAAGFVAWTAGSSCWPPTCCTRRSRRVRVDATDRPALAAAGLIVGVARARSRRWLPVAGRGCCCSPRWRRRRPASRCTPAGEAHLLLPLYAVLAVGWAVLGALELLRGEARRRSWAGPGGSAAAVLLLERALAAWSADQHQGGIEMLFFLLPFGFLLAARWRRCRRRSRDLRLALIVQVSLGLVFAAVAF